MPKNLGESKILEKVDPRKLIQDQDLRRRYAEAHVDNWEQIRRICDGYKITHFFILQPTSLYDRFSKGFLLENRLTDSEEYLYADYLVYEEFRHTIRGFMNNHSEINVPDMSSLLPMAAFDDGAHVYDEVNMQIAEKLAALLNGNLQQIIEKENQGR